MLTKKQHELLLYVNQHLRENGISPSFDEMKDALGLKSKSGIHRLITGLVERGFIHRLPHRARALEVLRMPEGAAVSPSATPGDGSGFPPNVIEGRFKPELPGSQPVPAGEVVELPLYGRIAAGMPIEALRDHSETVALPPHMVSGGEHYALEVEGDSMIDAGILDGDIAIIQRCDVAE
ncbi:MAG: LexA family transcriptional regulator, partial [Alphaproteobacteria bacterium]